MCIRDRNMIYVIVDRVSFKRDYLCSVIRVKWFNGLLLLVILMTSKLLVFLRTVDWFPATRKWETSNLQETSRRTKHEKLSVSWDTRVVALRLKKKKKEKQTPVSYTHLDVYKRQHTHTHTHTHTSCLTSTSQNILQWFFISLLTSSQYLTWPYLHFVKGHPSGLLISFDLNSNNLHDDLPFCTT